MICDRWILIRFVHFCVSRFVACDCNYDWWHRITHIVKAAFLTLEFPVFVKSTVKWNGYEACYTLSVTCFCYMCYMCLFFWTWQCTMFTCNFKMIGMLLIINSIPIILILYTNKNVTAIFSVTIILWTKKGVAHTVRELLT